MKNITKEMVKYSYIFINLLILNSNVEFEELSPKYKLKIENNNYNNYFIYIYIDKIVTKFYSININCSCNILEIKNKFTNIINYIKNNLEELNINTDNDDFIIIFLKKI